MYRMSHNITIGSYRLMLLESVRIMHSVEALSDTAEVVLPGTVMNVAIEVEDKIHRALGILKTARLMDHSEAMRLLSLVRLGVSAKKLETLSTDSIDKLIVEIQPASIMTKYGDDMSPRDRDIKRAEIIRTGFN
mgnify:CR=1 FL=1